MIFFLFIFCDIINNRDGGLMRDKTFKTLDEQLGIFKSKGLTINDEEEARNILLKENYFFQ